MNTVITDFESGHPDLLRALASEAETLLRENPDGLVGDDVTTFEELETQIERHRQIARIREAALDPRNLLPGDLPPNERIIGVHNTDPWASTRHGEPLNRSEMRARAISAAEIADLPDTAKEVLTGFVETDPSSITARWAVVTSDPHYASAFTKLVADPATGHRGFSPDELDAFRNAQDLKRAMAEGTGSAGGFLVPTILDSSLILTSAGVEDPLRTISRTVTTTSSSWNGVTTAGISSEWKAEAAVMADASPTIGQAPVPVFLADSYVILSYEVAQDSDVINQLTNLFAQAKLDHEATAFTTGTGSGQPTGFQTALDGSASEVAPATSEVFDPDDVYGLVEALPPRFRRRATWLAGSPTYNTIHRFWNPSGSEPPLFFDGDLLRKPFEESSSMRDTGDIDPAATADNFILAVGDFQQFIIADRIGSTVELIENVVDSDTGRPTGQRGIIHYWRVGSDVATVNAFRILNVATTA